jgi:hypothetical protein
VTGRSIENSDPKRFAPVFDDGRMYAGDWTTCSVPTLVEADAPQASPF